MAEVIKAKADYSEAAVIHFCHQDYNLPVPELEHSFDLLISQFAGFICEACKRYLKPRGLLLVNNSHGDAGIAALNPDFILCGVFNRRENNYDFSDKNLDRYFIPKKKVENLYKHIHDLGKGIAYTDTADLYLFQYAP